MPHPRQKFGKTGENVAADFLKKQGYKILERNHRNPMGEIDIIARDKRTLVFVEVKSRRSHGFGHPKYAVTYQKQRKISQTALYYLKTTRQHHVKARFDVVAVSAADENPRIEIIKNAFELAYG
jgi:putative endonuclease